MTANRLTDRAVIRLTPLEAGEDVAGFLQGLVTNDVSGALPAYAGLLTAQGKAMFDFLIWPGENGDLLIDCEAAAADDLVRRLSLYRLRRKIGIAVDPDLAVYWQATGDAGSPDPRLPELGRRWIGPAQPNALAIDDEYLRHRLSFGVAEGRDELSDILWLEANAGDLNGVSFTKGCYVGQENTARMNWRQKVNRRLVVVSLDRSQEKRQRRSWPELGLALDHLRVEDIDTATAPEWMQAALSPAD